MNTADKKRFRDMQEHPEEYSDQEIEAMMDDLDQPYDAEAEWLEFAAKQHRAERRSAPTLSLYKMAASFVGVLLFSGIAFGAFHLFSQHQERPVDVEVNSKAAANEQSAPTLTEDTATVTPVTFDNIPFEKMLAEIAAHYHAEVDFQNEDARQFRFYFVWYQEQPLQTVVETLNHFESVNITIDDKKLTVR